MNKIVKVRTEKEYPEAKSHVAIGEVLEEKAQYLRLRCRTYHFGRFKSKEGTKMGKIKVRCFPWEKIEVITELPQDIEWEIANFKLNKEGRLVLDDREETHIEDEMDSL